MNLLSLAEKLAGEAQAPVAFDADRCLHSGDKFAQCDACSAVCPTGAIQVGQPPLLDPDACERCFACLPACPTGALAMEDELPDLLRCLARVRELSDVDTLELVCEKHPAPAMGLRGNTAAIQVDGCLAGLGVAGYLQLAAQGTPRIVVRADACAGCPWQTLPAQVAERAAQAQQWLAALQQPTELEAVTEPDAATLPFVKRPVHRAGSPPVSRRDLFRGRMQEPPPVDIAGGRNPFHQRLRTLGALRQLSPARPGQLEPAPAGRGFASLQVSAACNACGTCARACPSGALLLEKAEDEAHFRLTFSLQACLGCDVCAHMCPEEAIEVDHNVTLQQLCNAPADELLVQGKLAQCRRCNAQFAANALKDGFCALCDFRRRNPFASITPQQVAGLQGASMQRASLQAASMQEAISQSPVSQSPISQSPISQSPNPHPEPPHDN